MSWSKTLSHDVAKYFVEWLPGVIQECSDPFISSDTAKGEPWFETITTNLDTTDMGLVFITTENMDASWLNFEAGAMLNKFGKSGVCPLLIGLKKEDYAGPMKNLQLTEIGDMEDMRLLLRTVNARCNKPLSDSVLTRAFEQSWDALTEKVAKASEKQKDAPPTESRSLDDKVDEILLLVRRAPNGEPNVGHLGETADDRYRAKKSAVDSRRKEKLASFKRRYGSLNGYRVSDKLDVEVLNFIEDTEGNLQRVLVKAEEDGEPIDLLAEDFVVYPF